MQCHNVANGNNPNISNFNATGNPELEFIVVDDIDYSTSNWPDIDSSSTFTLDNEVCQALSLENISFNEIKLYPNPAKDFFTIDGGMEIMEIRLYDVIGKRLKIYKNLSNSLNVSEIAQGMYIVYIKSAQGILADRLIIC